MPRFRPILLALLLPLGSLTVVAGEPTYKTTTGITFSIVDGTELKLNAFIPEGIDKPTPAVIHIHGGWWTKGRPSGSIKGGMWTPVRQRGMAGFSVQYRLGKNGGFPQNIRDCRNAVRYVRKHAKRFNVDPDRIAVMGGSAGGHLSMMVAMVPADFDDGGPTEGLEGVSAAAQAGFAWIGPTNLAKQWDDSVQGKPSNSRPYHSVLFHGVTPDTEAGRAEFLRCSPISYVRKDVPPLLICDGEVDPIVPGIPGKELVAKLKAAGASAEYWMTPNGKHGFPKGDGFNKLYNQLLDQLKN
jgi:acetyl esterase/lipase